MGRLFAGVAFDSGTSAEMAHQISKAAEQLTYRQLCIIKLSADKNVFKLRERDYRGQGRFSRELYQVLYECLDLYNRGLINFGGEVAFGPTEIKPGNLGTDIYNLMKLWTIPHEDLIPIAEILKQ